MQQRNETITMMKAFAILLMVTAHAGFYHQGQVFINMFHMPVFFFCSGYCFKEKYLNDARTFAVKRVKGIYWPYVKWSLLFLALHNVFFYLNLYNGEYGFRGNVSELYTWSIFAERAFHIVTKMYDTEQLLGGYWFLHTLFFASFLAYATIRIAKCKHLLTGGGTLLLISFAFAATNKHVPYFGIGEREFMAAAFFVSGYYTAFCKRGLTRLSFGLIDTTNKPYLQRRSDLSAASFGMIRNVLILILLFAVVLAASYLMPMGMLSLKAWGIAPYFAVALCGTFMTMILAQLADKHLSVGCLRNAITFIGDHTMEILTWHMLSFKLVSLLIIWIEQRPIQQLACFPVIPANFADVHYFTMWWTLYLIVGVAVPMAIVYIVEMSRNKQALNK